MAVNRNGLSGRSAIESNAFAGALTRCRPDAAGPLAGTAALWEAKVATRTRGTCPAAPTIVAGSLLAVEVWATVTRPDARRVDCRCQKAVSTRARLIVVLQRR